MSNEGLPLTTKTARLFAMWKALGHELEFQYNKPGPWGDDWQSSCNSPETFLNMIANNQVPSNYRYRIKPSK